MFVGSMGKKVQDKDVRKKGFLASLLESISINGRMDPERKHSLFSSKLLPMSSYASISAQQVNTEHQTYDAFKGISITDGNISPLNSFMEELEESEIFFGKVVEHSPISLVLLDADNSPVYLNRKFTETFGYTMDDLSSMKELWDHAFSSLDNGSDVVYTNELKMPCKNGSVKDVEVNTTKLTDDRMILLFKDLTQIKAAEKALFLDELRLEALVELNQLTGSKTRDILSFSLEKAVELTESQIGYIGFVNEDDSTVNMYAWSKSSMDLCDIENESNVYHFEETGLWCAPILQRMPVLTNSNKENEADAVSIPGISVDIRDHLGIPVFDDGKVVMIAGVGNKDGDYNSSDIRQMTLLMEGTWKLIQRKQSEDKIKAYLDQLARNNKELESLDRMKDEFMANITHELKTPLIPIKGYSELLFEGHLGALDEEQMKGVGMILQNTNRLQKLIDSLLYMQNIHSGNIQYHLDSIDIIVLLDKVTTDISSLKNDNSPALYKEYPSSVPFISGNSTYLEQVFSHILENAFKFTFHDGSITVKVSTEGNDLHVIVKDTGIGIPKEEMPHIFKRFYQADGSLTRRYGGNGLGLYLCKSIVEAHGGSIRAESEEGKGTEIHVFLPLIEKD